MHVICRAWNMFPPWGFHTIITFEWLGETYWHQKNTWFQIRRNSGSISVCHVGSRSSYALGFTYHGAVGAEVRQRGGWQGKLPASEARCLQGGNGRIWNWWSSMIIINLWLSLIIICWKWYMNCHYPNHFHYMRLGSLYSRRFATATARTASLGSHSRGIETKNIRKYWLSEKKREEFDGHV